MKQVYETPEIEVIDVKIEQGFAQSDPLEDVDRKPALDW
jgi:hypothetical protein